MYNLMFCSPAPCELGKIASSIAATMAPGYWDISYRSLGQKKTLQVHDYNYLYSDYNLDFSNISEFTAHETESIKFHVVISISPPDSDYVPTFSGMPVHIHWSLDDKLAGFEDKTSFKKLYSDLFSRVNKLFQEGMLDAVAQVRASFGALIDNLTDGVMAHDTKRKIFVFNQAAELITGYRASDVMGRDCHIVFPGRFCGGECSFCANESGFTHHNDRIRYSTSFTRHDGNTRDLEMSVVSLNNPESRLVGGLVIFRDTTEINTLRRTINEKRGFHGIIGRHPSMQKVFDSITELSNLDVPILIQGESGTGKEMVAKALHLSSSRSEQPFVPVNCGALPEGTLESELFGHVRGAFTGAIRDRKGRFELADNGILFLDEIGEISPNMQIKLLRVIQDNSFVQVGGEKTIEVNVRLICASNRDLKKATMQGKFREDLYYRLAVVPIFMPPLRERKSDIPLLVDFYLEQFSGEMGSPKLSVDKDAMSILLEHPWPGNVRELRNAVQYAIIKSRNSLILPHHLPPEIRDQYGGNRLEKTLHSGRPKKLTYELAVETLSRFDNNKAKAARHLGVSRTTLYRTLNGEL